jgi:XTP/dITP diphosphohydrolase
MAAPVMTLLVATQNQGKLAELRALLRDLPVHLVDPSEVLPGFPAPPELGDTFEANALEKARTYASEALLVTLADDSGLEVDALGGRPGVRSARFAGEGATDAENNAALLHALGQASRDEGDGAGRSARFRSVVALVDPWAEAGSLSSLDHPIVEEGACEGHIVLTPRGSSGFGYDPLFFLPAFGRTLAELTLEQKNQVSHRARAFARIRPAIEALVARKLAEAARLEPVESEAGDG